LHFGLFSDGQFKFRPDGCILDSSQMANLSLVKIVAFWTLLRWPIQVSFGSLHFGLFSVGHFSFVRIVAFWTLLRGPI